MIAPVILFQTYLIFGKITETQGILILGICLIVLTIGIRWFLKKTKTAASSNIDKRET